MKGCYRTTCVESNAPVISHASPTPTHIRVHSTRSRPGARLDLWVQDARTSSPICGAVRLSAEGCLRLRKCSPAPGSLIPRRTEPNAVRLALERPDGMGVPTFFQAWLDEVRTERPSRVSTAASILNSKYCPCAEAPGWFVTRMHEMMASPTQPITLPIHPSRRRLASLGSRPILSISLGGTDARSCSSGI